MSSDEKALELEVDEKLLGVIARSKQWGAAEERQRILGLPCMEEEETDIEIKEIEENNQILGRNNLRRELKEEIKEEPTTPEKEHPLYAKPFNEMPKKICQFCGINYQDPTYCSVWGRSADKHKWI